MADLAPRIRCDNCGSVSDKQKPTISDGKYTAPSSWGNIHAVGGGFIADYGAKARLDFSDLCEKCAKVALDAAAAALEKARSEGFDGPTGAPGMVEKRAPADFYKVLKRFADEDGSIREGRLTALSFALAEAASPALSNGERDG